ncbi:MAG: four-carbon acid sugar kinase family protein [Synergistaceae bacterium]|nr:four-carbon acid sugar kinase family protein [Synergistaceae bacterium]
MLKFSDLKLLVIADDFTGALDTGVQFSSMGAAAKVVTDSRYDFNRALNLDVLIFDAETRHLTPDKAYKIVHDFTARAKDFGVPYIYKKTDSGLRGNIGSELAACLDALGLESMAFIPAFPAMKRITKNGIHYIDGVQVNQSMFARDPFEPVKESDVNKIIALQTDKNIRVYDSESDSDMMNIAQSLGSEGLRLTAGCAGFAGVLAKVLGFESVNESSVPEMPKQFFMICGSVNPVTIAQIDFAESHGFKRIYLRVQDKLNPDWPDSKSCKEFARKILNDIQDSNAILDSNNPGEKFLTDEYIKSHALSIEQVRLYISRSVTGAAKALLDEGLNARLMCVGGDTLLALMQAVNVHELVPVCEIEKGVVLTSFIYHDKNYYIMAKSGGFGDKDLLVKISG